MTARRSLKGGRDFARVFRSGRRARRDGILVFVAPSTEGEPARLGLSVRSTAGGAVDRNRIKRRLREVWRSLDVADGVDVVIGADSRAVRARFQELEKHVAGALSAAGGLR